AEAREPLGFLRLITAYTDQRDMLRVDHAGSEAIERIIVLAEQPRERHAVQSPAVTGGRRMAIHVRVDPQQAKAAVEGARDAAPCAAGTAVITAKHAGKPSFAARIGYRGSELAAQPAHRELLASLAFRGLQHW